jgi:predicted esterase
MSGDPHRDAPVQTVGAPLAQASGAIILLHGRGGSAEDILGLAQELHQPRLAYLAPQASGHSWYPNSFLAPREQNEPWLSSALRRVEALVESITQTGIAPESIVIAGFSQGACLSTEFVATHPRRYAALLAFTGGLIGPPHADLRHTGDLAGTPALFASGDPDPHVPWQRVLQSAEILAGMGAAVTAKRYPGRPHTVGREEIELARAITQAAFAA